MANSMHLIPSCISRSALGVRGMKVGLAKQLLGRRSVVVTTATRRTVSKRFFLDRILMLKVLVSKTIDFLDG